MSCTPILFTLPSYVMKIKLNVMFIYIFIHDWTLLQYLGVLLPNLSPPQLFIQQQILTLQRKQNNGKEKNLLSLVLNL